MTRILVTGAGGQIGTELTASLRERHGADSVMATDLKDPETWHHGPGPAQRLDCLDGAAVAEAVSGFQADRIFHLAAILSARGEENPKLAWDVNMGSLLNVLEAARGRSSQLFVPSSIAAFGPDTPRDPTPQRTLQRPTTMYGVTKVSGELICDYYHTRFGLDVRGVRFPGLISYTAPPGGGTTDYAVEIFHEALKRGRYTCFLGPETRLDMMYMADGVRAAIEVMEAPPGDLEDRNAFNVTAMQITPAELADAIRTHLPGFEIDYAPDPLRQDIADSWPQRLDDSAAREQWGWNHEYDLERMVSVMLEGVRSTGIGSDQERPSSGDEGE